MEKLEFTREELDVIKSDLDYIYEYNIHLY